MDAKQILIIIIVIVIIIIIVQLLNHKHHEHDSNNSVVSSRQPRVISNKIARTNKPKKKGTRKTVEKLVNTPSDNPAHHQNGHHHHDRCEDCTTSLVLKSSIITTIDEPGHFVIDKIIDDGPSGGSQRMVEDFEGQPPALDVFSPNTTVTIVSNPVSGGINTSATVMCFFKDNGAPTWAGLQFPKPGTPYPTIDLVNNNTISMKIYSPKVGARVRLKIVTEFSNSGPEVDVDTTVANQWEELIFNFTNVPPAPVEGYSVIEIKMDEGQPGDGSTYYIDEILLYNTPTNWLIISSPGVCIDGCWNVLENITGAFYGIDVKPGSDNFILENIIVRGFSENGVRVLESNNIRIEKVNVEECGNTGNALTGGGIFLSGRGSANDDNNAISMKNATLVNVNIDNCIGRGFGHPYNDGLSATGCNFTRTRPADYQGFISPLANAGFFTEGNLRYPVSYDCKFEKCSFNGINTEGNSLEVNMGGYTVLNNGFNLMVAEGYSFIDCDFSNNKVFGSHSNISAGCDLSFARAFTFTRCTFDNIHGDGSETLGVKAKDCKDLTFADCESSGQTSSSNRPRLSGWTLESTQQCKFVRCIVRNMEATGERQDAEGFRLDRSYDIVQTECEVMGLRGTSQARAFYTDRGGAVIWKNCIAKDLSVDSLGPGPRFESNPYAVGFVVARDDEPTTIIECIAEKIGIYSDFPGQGFRLESSNNQTTIKKCIGNYNGTHGLYLQGNCSKILVHGNCFSDNRCYGIQEQPDATGGHDRNNIFKHNIASNNGFFNYDFHKLSVDFDNQSHFEGGFEHKYDPSFILFPDFIEDFDVPTDHAPLNAFPSPSTIALISNPFLNGENTVVSDVIHFHKAVGTPDWSGLSFPDPGSGYPLALPMENYNKATMKVHGPFGHYVNMRIEGTSGGNTVEEKALVTKNFEWQTLTFLFPSVPSAPPGGYTRIVMFPSLQIPGDGQDWYFDDLVFSYDCSFSGHFILGGGPEPWIYEDFEDNAANYWIFGSGATFNIVNNPDPDAVNSSALVGCFHKAVGGNTWSGIGQFGQVIEMDCYNQVKMLVYSPRVGVKIQIGLEDGGQGGPNTTRNRYTDVANQWELLIWDFSGVQGNKWGDLIIKFDEGEIGLGENFYFDRVCIDWDC